MSSYSGSRRFEHNSNKLRLICPNPDCINKSVVYRKFDAMKDQLCFNCQHSLTAAKSFRAMRQDEKAKRDLSQFNL